jgi:hypothetical protein
LRGPTIDESIDPGEKVERSMPATTLQAYRGLWQTANSILRVAGRGITGEWAMQVPCCDSRVGDLVRQDFCGLQFVSAGEQLLQFAFD